MLTGTWLARPLAGRLCRHCVTCGLRLKRRGRALADVAHLTVYIVDYTAASLDVLMEAAIGEYGEAYPITACTLVGVAALWQAEVLIEIDALAVV